MRKRALVAPFVATIALAGAADVALAGWRVSGTTVAAGHAADARLEVSGGQVSGLYPGGARPASVQVHNVNDFPVQFHGFWFENVVVDPEHAACPPTVLAVGAWSPDTAVLLPLQVESFQVDVLMDPNAPQSCLGATFEITWVAEGGVGTLP